MSSKSKNIAFMPYDKTNEVVHELFESLLSRYQICLGTSMRGRSFIFDLVEMLYSKCQKIHVKCGSLYIDSENQIKNSNKFKK